MLSSAFTMTRDLHATCAVLTLLLFVWRGRMAIAGRVPRQRWQRYIPDTVDSLLLLSGILLVVQTGQYPFETPWITVKLFAVLAYIGLGFVLFRFARTRGQRLAAWLAALGVFSAIVWLAVLHHIQ